MSLKKYGIAVDGGNAKVKGITYIDGEAERITFPSVRTKGNLEDLARVRSADGRKQFKEPQDALEFEEYVIQLDGQPTWFYGDLALEQDDMEASSGRGDPGRYSSPRMKEMVAIVAAATIPEKEAEICVVTNLPNKTYDPATTCKDVISNLKGRHYFTFGGERRFLYISDVKVLQEGAGAALVLAKKEDESSAFIDLGGYSTDFYACDEKKRAIAKYCGGISRGVEHVSDLINERYRTYFQVDSDLSLKTRKKLIEAYTYPTAKTYPTVAYKGQVAPVDDVIRWVHDAFLAIAQDINEEISKLWKGNERRDIASQFRKVYLIGGGAIAFQPLIEKRVGGVIVPEYPEWKNVEGEAIYAKAIAEAITR